MYIMAIVLAVIGFLSNDHLLQIGCLLAALILYCTERIKEKIDEKIKNN